MNPFDIETLPVGRWRNGGGDTREIGSQSPTHAAEADFDWRASIATIAADGPFSTFPGVDRTITLLAGEGVRLVGDDGLDHRLNRPGEPFAFSGDAHLRATLLGGDTRVLNIMTRRGRWAARVHRVQAPVVPPAGHAGVLYVLSAPAGDGSGSALRAGQGVWWASGAADPAAPLASGTVALWADLRPL
ncbi:HutD/Ves family protein [Embleya scabrispora]|uniref:HutD/Ves family protein n=1 Tax=Embleya scabrispora TaxID=159449 RepID=UPI00037543F6|nr:HutD family protein [Embleya scabrispora]MYS84005.1 HutD family protein [Streptomyces sp. SID5474]